MPTQRHGDLASTNIQHANSNTISLRFSPLRQRDTLPSALQNAMPQCGRTCLSNYIGQQFTGCYNNQNLGCLCTNYSAEGYTLGELALLCLEQACPDATYAQQQDTYGVCGAQASAVSATHETLTLSATPTTTAGITTTTVWVYATTPASGSISSIRSKTTLETSVWTSATAFTGTVISKATATSTPTTSSPSATSTAEAAKGAHHSTTLTSAQAVGVSVAAFGGLALILLLIWLSACLRRRKATCKSPGTKHDSYDFIDDAPPRFTPFHHGYADPHGPLGGFAGQRTELLDYNRANTQWYDRQLPDRDTHEKYGSFDLKLGHETSLPSNKSNNSLRIVSQLLPDKPGSTPPVPPAKQFTPRMTSIRSPETKPEEYKTPRVPRAQPPPRPQRPQLAHIPQGLPGKGVKVSTTYAAHYPRWPGEALPLSLSIGLPRNASRAAMRVPPPIKITPPPVPQNEPQVVGDRASRGSNAKSGASGRSGVSLLDYYASPSELELPANQLGRLHSSCTQSSLEPRRRIKPVPFTINVTKPKYPPRAVRRPPDSYRSDTSFESTDTDEPTSPEEDKQLSPVAEQSPIAAIRYPKVPRSSNQSIPRSPAIKLQSPNSSRQLQQANRDDWTTLPRRSRQLTRDRREMKTPERQATDNSTLSGSTLAQKREGGDTDQTRSGLYIDTSYSRVGSTARAKVNSDPHSGTSTPCKRNQQNSPSKCYGRVTRNGPASTGRRRYSRTASNGLLTSSSEGGLLTPEMVSPIAKVVRRHVATGEGYRTQEVILKSPLWEPKLTPRRKGDDLYLELGLATPGIISEEMPLWLGVS